jgi:hypothetical protein
MREKRKRADDRVIVSGPEIAAKLGIMPTTASKLGGDGVLVRVSRGRYDLWPSILGYANYLRRASAGKESPAVHARAVLLTIEAKRAQMRLDRESGKYIDGDEAQRYMAAYILVHRREMMAIPDRLASELLLSREATERLRDLFAQSLTEYVKNLQGMFEEIEKKAGLK